MQKNFLLRVKQTKVAVQVAVKNVTVSEKELLGALFNSEKLDSNAEFFLEEKYYDKVGNITDKKNRNASRC